MGATANNRVAFLSASLMSAGAARKINPGLKDRV